MAVYGDTNTKVKTFIHDASEGAQDGSTGTIARDVQDYIAALDDANNIVVSVSHCALRGDRVLTMVVAMNYNIPTS
tara:strand:+ start:949 stop:1176 length:228 start_codon:yes stop_codon:yes gene_type:complete